MPACHHDLLRIAWVWPVVHLATVTCRVVLLLATGEDALGAGLGPFAGRVVVTPATATAAPIKLLAAGVPAIIAYVLLRPQARRERLPAPGLWAPVAAVQFTLAALASPLSEPGWARTPTGVCVLVAPAVAAVMHSLRSNGSCSFRPKQALLVVAFAATQMALERWAGWVSWTEEKHVYGEAAALVFFYGPGVMVASYVFCRAVLFRADRRCRAAAALYLGWCCVGQLSYVHPLELPWSNTTRPVALEKEELRAALKRIDRGDPLGFEQAFLITGAYEHGYARAGNFLDEGWDVAAERMIAFLKRTPDAVRHAAATHHLEARLRILRGDDIGACFHLRSQRLKGWQIGREASAFGDNPLPLSRQLDCDRLTADKRLPDLEEPGTHSHPESDLAWQ